MIKNISKVEITIPTTDTVFITDLDVDSVNRLAICCYMHQRLDCYIESHQGYKLPLIKMVKHDMDVSVTEAKHFVEYYMENLV